MDNQPQPTPGRADHVRQVLAVYGQTPRTTGQIHRPDGFLADQLYQRGIPLKVVENALLLAAARRLLRPPEAAPLSTIRSLAYFFPVIDEVLQLQVGNVLDSLGSQCDLALLLSQWRFEDYWKGRRAA